MSFALILHFMYPLYADVSAFVGDTDTLGERNVWPTRPS